MCRWSWWWGEGSTGIILLLLKHVGKLFGLLLVPRRSFFLLSAKPGIVLGGSSVPVFSFAHLPPHLHAAVDFPSFDDEVIRDVVAFFVFASHPYSLDEIISCLVIDINAVSVRGRS